MFRTLLAAAAVYACGHPSLKAYRPAPLDKPLQGIYEEINLFAGNSRQALGVLNDARTMRYLEVIMVRLDGELRPLK